MPFALITAAASGVRRKSTSAFAASALSVPPMMAAAKTMVSCIPRQRANDFDAGDRYHFLDYVHADLGLAVCHHAANRCRGFGVGEDRLRLHLVGDPQAIEEGVSHVLDLSEGSSKLIPIHEEPNHQIVHLFRLGKANRTTH